MRFDSRVIAGNLVLAASVFTWAGQAAGLALTARAEGQVLGNVRVDSQGPAASGSLLAAVRFPGAFRITFTDTAYAQAAMNDSGAGAVIADGAFHTSASDFLRAEATWSETVTNTNPIGYEYVYHFTLTPPRLTLVDATGDGESVGLAVAQYEIVVELNGNPIFRSNAQLTGTLSSHTLTEQGTDLGGAFFSNFSQHTIGYAFAPFTGNLSLGFYFPGQGFTITARLVAFASSPAAERGARAEIGDPLELGGEPGIRGSFFLAVPLNVESKTWSGIKNLYR